MSPEAAYLRDLCRRALEALERRVSPPSLLRELREATQEPLPESPQG